VYDLLLSSLIEEVLLEFEKRKILLLQNLNEDLRRREAAAADSALNRVDLSSRVGENRSCEDR
jgi:hypothetical protein